MVAGWRFSFVVAFRIHECVVRGEIDNRTKGFVTGKVWLVERAEPVVLELRGNACGDLAGCFLEFRDRVAAIVDSEVEALASMQRGDVGDLTASRKVRVFDVPVKEAYMMGKRREKAPEHL